MTLAKLLKPLWRSAAAAAARTDSQRRGLQGIAVTAVVVVVGDHLRGGRLFRLLLLPLLLLAVLLTLLTGILSTGHGR